FLLLSLLTFTATATVPVRTPSLHDALPICLAVQMYLQLGVGCERSLHAGHQVLGGAAQEVDHDRSRRHRIDGSQGEVDPVAPAADRKSTRLNSSHVSISYAVLCLKQ